MASFSVCVIGKSSDYCWDRDITWLLWILCHVLLWKVSCCMFRYGSYLFQIWLLVDFHLMFRFRKATLLAVMHKERIFPPCFATWKDVIAIHYCSPIHQQIPSHTHIHIHIHMLMCFLLVRQLKFDCLIWRLVCLIC